MNRGSSTRVRTNNIALCLLIANAVRHSVNNIFNVVAHAGIVIIHSWCINEVTPINEVTRSNRHVATAVNMIVVS